MASYITFSPMAKSIALPAQRFDRIPALLLGGVNLVRALGLAGIPVIVASPEESEPAFASRYCVARCVLPPLSRPSAVVDAIVRQRDALTTKVRKKIGRASAEARKLRGELPGFMKKKAVKKPGA